MISFVFDIAGTETAKIINCFLVASGNPVSIIGSAVRMVYQADSDITVLSHPFVALDNGQFLGDSFQESGIKRIVIHGRKRFPQGIGKY